MLSWQSSIGKMATTWAQGVSWMTPIGSRACTKSTVTRIPSPGVPGDAELSVPLAVIFITTLTMSACLDDTHMVAHQHPTCMDQHRPIPNTNRGPTWVCQCSLFKISNIGKQFDLLFRPHGLHAEPQLLQMLSLHHVHRKWSPCPNLCWSSG